MPGGLYAQPLSLLTDLYQITMAAAAWQAGVDARDAVSHLVFRQAPFHSGFTVAAGLGPALELLRELKLGEDDLRYLAEVRAAPGGPLFEPGFLEALRALEPRGDSDP